MTDETPTVGEQMNRDLYLSPGLHPDKSRLREALEEEIDETAARAKAAQHPEPQPPEHD